jgi:hypothetical protein
MDYTLSNEQRQVLRDCVRTKTYRDGGGRYWVLGRPFDSLEECEGWALEVCQAKRKPPLTVFHEHELEVARNAELDRGTKLRGWREYEAYKATEHYREQAEKKEYLERVGKGRIKEMGRKLSWKTDE